MCNKYEKPDWQIYVFKESDFIVTLGISGEGDEGTTFDQWIQQEGS